MGLKRARIAWEILLVLTALLGATFTGRPFIVLAGGGDGLPLNIEALYNAGQYRQAADALQAEVERNPKNGELYFWLARCFFELRDFSQSISSFERAVALDPAR